MLADRRECEVGNELFCRTEVQLQESNFDVRNTNLTTKSIGIMYEVEELKIKEKMKKEFNLKGKGGVEMIREDLLDN